LTVTDKGPRTYVFNVEYSNANTRGEIVTRQRLIGEYTRGLPDHQVAWSHVTLEEASGPSGPYGAPKKREFLEGFHYRNDLGITLQPDFFKTFPPDAVIDRNLIWDTGMIELYGQTQFEHLQLNVPFSYISNDNTKMPELGTFNNRNVVLEWVGNSQRNGQPCAVITYKAFFNDLDIKVGVKLKGRSNYWGEIWVSLKSKQIEFSTLYEDVLGELTLPGQDSMQVINVLRSATFSPK
jgi:hypothetical protein